MCSCIVELETILFPVTMTRHVERRVVPATPVDSMGVEPASRGLADVAVEDIVTYTVDREEYSLAMQQYDTWLKGTCSIDYAAVIT